MDQGRYPPPGTFRGTNFMTPEVMIYVKLRHGLGWAELSRGTGFRQQPIFGVTVRDNSGNDPGGGLSGGRLSRMFESEAEAMKYIRSLS